MNLYRNSRFRLRPEIIRGVAGEFKPFSVESRKSYPRIRLLRYHAINQVVHTHMSARRITEDRAVVKISCAYAMKLRPFRHWLNGWNRRQALISVFANSTSPFQMERATTQRLPLRKSGHSSSSSSLRRKPAKLATAKTVIAGSGKRARISRISCRVYPYVLTGCLARDFARQSLAEFSVSRSPSLRASLKAYREFDPTAEL